MKTIQPFGYNMNKCMLLLITQTSWWASWLVTAHMW